MNNEKVYIDGYVVGLFADTLGMKGKRIQLANGDIVDIDDNFIHKSIEPKKVEIPQFVADVIEGAREQSAELEDAFEYARDAAFRGELGEWFMKLENRNTFARAWLDGYEVKKEKRYLVKLKGVVSNFMVLKHNINEDTWYMSNKINYTDLKAYHTKKQLEQAGFGEVFNSPLFEIEEVEE